MIDKLCKRDLEWRRLALKICGCPNKADDLVQEMYLKLMNEKREPTTSYVYNSMKWIFIDSIRKVNPEIPTDDFNKIKNIEIGLNLEEVKLVIKKIVKYQII